MAMQIVRMKFPPQRYHHQPQNPFRADLGLSKRQATGGRKLAEAILRRSYAAGGSVGGGGEGNGGDGRVMLRRLGEQRAL
jgi:hypothetical protein